MGHRGSHLTLLLTFLPGATLVAQTASAAPRLPLVLLPQPLALCQFPPGTPTPGWVSGAEGFMTLSRTPTELSITLDEGAVPADVPCERGYRAFKVQGPLPLNLIGILESVARPLAEQQISIFAISTYETDYVLVKQTDLAAARAALVHAGHAVTD